MKRFAFTLSAVAILAFGLGSTGCSESATPTTSDAGNRAAEGEVAHDHSHDGHSHDGHTHEGEHADHDHGDGDKIAVALAKLSPEDRQSAEAQKICPVSDHALGSMDAPVKIQVKGQDVWVCCAGCKDPLEADPDKYLAKIEKK